ncbi:MAG TPA: hypothetical protein VK928_00330 [Longimicrobiales bacterium]|nr:hypothetical protein [Longimicrobiales bacterium]
MWRVILLMAAAGLVTGCELREVTAAEAQDVVIAEVILRAGAGVQTAYLHRTATGDGTARVFDARVEVRDAASGETFQYLADADSLCLTPAPPPGQGSTGTCYVARGSDAMVRPGTRYQLRIELKEGGVMTGTTTVPGDFTVLTPATSSCLLEPMTTLELAWTQSDGASLYIIGARMRGLRSALTAAGTPVPPGDDPELVGLSVTAADTTLLFPSELGLFSRFDDDLHPILLAIRDGLPAQVLAELGVAAVDNNYVNWVRGGTFNPSGMVRISSVDGDGHGVFGSQNVRLRRIQTPGPPSNDPPCR